MKFLEYILKFGFGYALSFVLVFSITPHLYHATFNKDENDLKKEIQSLKIYKPSTYYDGFYIQIIDNKGVPYYIASDINAKGNKGLFQFLRKNRFLKTNESIKDILPFELTKREIIPFHPISYEIEGPKIISLLIDNSVIIGTPNNFKKKIVIISLTIFLGLAGIFGGVIMTLVLIDVCKIYKKTGSWPDLPNSFNSKVYGLKWILNGFKRPMKKS